MEDVMNVRLVLPLPVSPNSWGGHPIAVQKRKDSYRAAAWIKAVRQVPPRAIEDLPDSVTVDAHFDVGWNRWDEDNLTAGMKWVLDTIRAKQRGRCRWRNGLYESKGYIVDDDPAHLTLGEVRQSIDRKTNVRRVVVVIRGTESRRTRP